MKNIANAINNFPPEPTVELPLSSFQDLFSDLVSIHNLLVEIVEEAGILRGSKLSRITKQNEDALLAEKDPVTRMLLLNAFIKQHIIRVRDALKSRPDGRVIQVATKIQARAIQIIDYIKNTLEGKKEISLESSQCRLLFSGKDITQVSRRDTIRAMKRAEVLWPALRCEHRPDGRRTTRLVGHVNELSELPPEFECRNTRQRSGMQDLKIMFNLA